MASNMKPYVFRSLIRSFVLMPSAEMAIAGSDRCLLGLFPTLMGDLFPGLYAGWLSSRNIRFRVSM